MRCRPFGREDTPSQTLIEAPPAQAAARGGCFATPDPRGRNVSAIGVFTPSPAGEAILNPRLSPLVFYFARHLSQRRTGA